MAFSESPVWPTAPSWVVVGVGRGRGPTGEADLAWASHGQMSLGVKPVTLSSSSSSSKPGQCTEGSRLGRSGEEAISAERSGSACGRGGHPLPALRPPGPAPGPHLSSWSLPPHLSLALWVTVCSTLGLPLPR